MKTTSCTESNIYAFNNAPRCGARTKRNNGSPCRAPAIRGKSRCRLHGGSRRSGGQKGNQNALKHGYTTKQAKNFRKNVSNVLRESKVINEFIINPDDNQDLQ